MKRNCPNIILFMTDQQRFDTINALGAGFMQTPTLDRLVKGGVTFNQCYCAAPSCVPSRASFFNLKYPHETGVFHNACQWDTSWVTHLQKAGYHTVNIGKMHTVPMDAPCGFDQRFVVENKDRPLRLNRPHGNFYDEWDKFLNNSNIRKPSRQTYRNEYPGYEDALGAYEWPLDERYHPDVFVGDMARWFIEQRQDTSPLMMVVGFPGPHPPYDPPQRHLNCYDDTDIPIPCVSQAEVDAQPTAHHVYRQQMIENNHDGVRWQHKPTDVQLLRLRKYYAANVTLIDEQIGHVMQALDKRGYLEDAIVIFTSDHGDCLGDHGHIQKWTMYDCVTRTPVIVHAPGRLPSNQSCNALLQQMDVVPMLFSLAGVPLPGGHSAIDALPVVSEDSPGREYVFAEHTADNVFTGASYMAMVRNEHWKLVQYQDSDQGELYDLTNDPGELVNVWLQPTFEAVKEHLISVLNAWYQHVSINH